MMSVIIIKRQFVKRRNMALVTTRAIDDGSGPVP